MSQPGDTSTPFMEYNDPLDRGQYEPKSIDLQSPLGTARRCTDVGCLLIFVIYYLGLTGILQYAITHGDIRKVTHGIDWAGDICGLGSQTSHPKLYWCSSEGTTLSDPICVAECPTSSTTQHECPGVPIMTDSTDLTDHTRSITLSRKFENMTDLETIDILNYCLPTKDKDLMVQILRLPQLSGYSTQIFVALHSVYAGWPLLIMVVIFAVAVSFGYLYFLKHFVKPVIIALFSVTLLLLLALGMWGLLAYHDPDLNFLLSYIAESKAKQCALVTGCVGLSLALLFTCFWLAAAKGIETTCESIEDACETISGMPSILTQPLLQSFIQGCCLIILVGRLLFVISLGTVEKDIEIPDPGLPLMPTFKGVNRSFRYSSEQWYMIAYVLWGSLWIYEIVIAAGEYAISHAVVIKYRMGDNASKWFPLIRAYLNGLVFHLGTLACGAFLIGIMKVVTGTVSWVSRQATLSDGSVKENAVAKIIAGCCGCCLTLLTQVMQMANELIYVDVVMYGHRYTAAAWHVGMKTLMMPVTVTTMLSCVRAVRAVGIVSITGIGTFVVYRLMTHQTFIARLCSDGLEQLREIGIPPVSMGVTTTNALGLTVASGVILFFVSLAFMNTFVMTAQTIAYCKVCEEQES